jgi:hypothetical protein
MATINYSNPRTDQTVKIFDQFYAYETVVPADEYDTVNSYFKSVFKTTEAAGNFTITLFRMAQQSDIPVMELLQQIQGQTLPELTLTLAYYLNGLRSKATLLGVNASVTPNYYVARNVRQ